MEITLAKVQFFAERQWFVEDLPRLRAYLSQRYKEYHELHNHTTEGGYRFVYPEIQFKFIDGVPTIVGFERGREILERVFKDVEHVELKDRAFQIFEKTFEHLNYKLGVSEKPIAYRFVTPWMALKQENYQRFKTLDNFERQRFLRHLLRENLKTIAHAFGYWIPDPEEIQVEGFFHQRESKFKGMIMLTFTGEFMTNFRIPDWLGLGKQVARGFGTVFHNDKQKSSKTHKQRHQRPKRRGNAH